MEEKTKKRLSVAAPIAAGVGTYLLSRHPSSSGMIRKIYGKYKEPVIVRNPEFDKLPKEALQGKTLKERLKARLKHVYNRLGTRTFRTVGAESEKKMPEAVKKLKENEMLLGMEATGDPHKIKLPKVPGQRRALQAHDPEGLAIIDKLRHGQKLFKHKMGPETRQFTPAQIRQIKRTQPKHMEALIEKMYGSESKRPIGSKGVEGFPEQSVIVKPRHDYMFHIGGSEGGGDMVPFAADSRKVYKNIKKYPKDYIVQTRHDINKYPTTKEPGEPGMKEFRVTAVNGKVVNITPRHAGSGFDAESKFFNWKKHKEIQDLVSRHAKHIQPKGKLVPISFDVAYGRHPMSGGAYKPFIVEGNLGVSGGDLDNPMIARKLYKAITGRTPVWEAGAKGVGAAGLTHVALKKALKDKENGKK